MKAAGFVNDALHQFKRSTPVRATGKSMKSPDSQKIVNLPDAPGKPVPVRHAVLSAAKLAEFAAAIVELRAEFCDGATQRETAEWIGVSPALLSQLRAGRKREGGRSVPVERVDDATATALWNAIYRLRDELRGSLSARDTREHIGRLEALLSQAVRPPIATERLASYAEWCMERASRFFRRRGDRWVIRSEGGEPILERVSGSVPVPPGLQQPAWNVAGGQDLLDRWVEVHRRQDTIMLVIAIKNASKSAERELVRLEKACEGLPDLRYRVALMRVLEPLLEAPESGFVEMDQGEMTAKDLGEFIRLGVERELMLLRRASDAERASTLPLRPVG